MTILTLKRKILAVIATVAVTASLAGCSFMNQTSYNALGDYDFSQMELVQLQQPEKGTQMAVIETDFGTIKAVLYPEYAPKTVENFINRANEGYYDNQPIYCIYEDYYFLGGGKITIDEDGNETGYIGATDDGQAIAAECNVNLWPFRGSFMAYNETGGFSDSRFFINNTIALTQEEVDQLKSFTDEEGNRVIPDELITAFLQKGSLPHIAGSYTVFAQAISGFDVIEEIVSQEKDPDTYRPLEQILINKVTISEYDPEVDGYEFPDVPEDERIAPSETTADTTAA